MEKATGVGYDWAFSNGVLVDFQRDVEVAESVLRWATVDVAFEELVF